MELNIITQEQSLINLQKIYFSYGIYKEFYGKVVYLYLESNDVYICKVFAKPLLQQNICLLDKTVQCNLDHTIQVDDKLNKIELIPTVEVIKKLAVTIIFKDALEKEKWRNNHLKRLVQHVLQFLIIKSNSFINISQIEEFKKLGISFIQVFDIGLGNGVGKVVNSTKLFVKDCLSLEYYNISKKEIEKVYFHHKPFNELKEILISRRNMSTSITLPLPQIMIDGPSGCGKKSIIKQVCNNTKTILFTVDCSTLCRPEPGEIESLLKSKFQYALLLSKECMVVLLLVRLEVFGCNNGRILIQINALIDSLMQNKSIIVIVPTCNSLLFHQSLRTRFLHQIFIGSPNETERAEILETLCDNIKLKSEIINEISRFTPGFVLADLALLVNRVKRHLATKNDVSLSGNRLELFRKYASVIEPSTVRGELGLVKSNQELQDIGGVEEIKKSLKQLVQWPLLHPEAFKTLNIKHPSGILLYGPPGCAKTSLVRAIAAESNITFLAVSAADLYSPYVGDAEQTIARLFHRARSAAPTLLFIDEIDALVGSREGQNKGAQDRVLSAFLTEMDGVGHKITTPFGIPDEFELKVIVAAATNRPNMLDSALLRPGRLDRLIYVPPPDRPNRLEILKVLCAKLPIDEHVNLEVIADKTELFTGADLTNLCREAALYALTNDGMDIKMLQHHHFLTALKEMKPSLTQNVIKWFADFKFS